MPNYLQDAVVTPVGYAHPLTGEQLNARKDLADPVAYYRPNSRKAFLDPALSTQSLVMFQRNGRTVRFAHQSKIPVSTVSWNFGDGTTIVGGKKISHTYATDDTFTVVATATAVQSATNNRVASIAVTVPGTGYVTATVAIAAPPTGGTQATATATTDGDTVTGITVVNPGTGYLVAPAVTITTGNGDATATATIAPVETVVTSVAVEVAA